MEARTFMHDHIGIFIHVGYTTTINGGINRYIIQNYVANVQ